MVECSNKGQLMFWYLRSGMWYGYSYDMAWLALMGCGNTCFYLTSKVTGNHQILIFSVCSDGVQQSRLVFNIRSSASLKFNYVLVLIKPVVHLLPEVLGRAS